MTYKQHEAIRMVHDLAACDLVHLGSIGDVASGCLWQAEWIEQPHCAAQWIWCAGVTLGDDDHKIAAINDVSKSSEEFCNRLREAFPEVFEMAFE